ncbi:MAG TPA: thiamine pyrophosphate-dependent dehydrogenase E1 component subunit alpha [Aggregatilineales bacterium]|nr:thiamine pyrophosphate-dependent dehydrogenase E1 component subunit alpha [Aggregatilineales bacterium]
MAKKKTKNHITSEALAVSPSETLSTETLLAMYRDMLMSRRIDERAWIIHRQGKIAFHVSAIGQEACQVAAAYAINTGIDYVCPYYRDLALALTIGVPPLDFFKSLYGKAGEISSQGRQMPSHFSVKKLNIVSGSSVVATQVTHAAGLAFAIKYRIEQGLQDPDDENQPRLALTCLGEGSTSQGDWHEALNWAGVHQLPFICMVQNNQYAISESVEKQMAVQNVADRAAAYGIEGVIVDGNDILACYDVLYMAAQKAYRGEGATLIEAKTYRMTPHSSDDDDRSYRTADEVEAWKEKDPIKRFQEVLLERGVLTDKLIEEINAEIMQEVDKTLKTAEAAPLPPPEAAVAPVYAPVIGGN